MAREANLLNDRDFAEWFQALTSRELSRNKNYLSFSNEQLRAAHKRFLKVQRLKREAARLVGIPDSFCIAESANGDVHFSFECPKIKYRHHVTLFPYEWAWLNRHKEIQMLLRAASLDLVAESASDPPLLAAIRPQQPSRKKLRGIPCS
jgi:hypothetical protein